MDHSDEHAEAFRYPYRYLTCSHGIRPNHVSQAQMDETVRRLYETWRKLYLRTDGCPENDMLRVWSGAGNYRNGTCSEAMGYGLLLSVYMDDGTNGAHEDFDALFRYYRYYTMQAHGAHTEGLMAWRIDAQGKAVSGYAATDGDLDAAFALVQASVKWKDGALDYRREAERQIGIMMEHLVNHDRYALLAGDVPTGTFVMSAYLMPAWFHTFFEITGDERWLRVVDFCVKAYRSFLAQNPETGLAPYRFRIDSFLPVSEKDRFSWDSCRVPWRVGLDYLWNGTAVNELAREYLSTVVRWFYRSTGSVPANHVETYALDGTPLGSFPSPTIAGPMAVAAMAVPEMQTFLNDLYDHLSAIPLGAGDDRYYCDALQMLTLLAVSGNFPNLFNHRKEISQ